MREIEFKLKVKADAKRSVKELRDDIANVLAQWAEIEGVTARITRSYKARD